MRELTFVKAKDLKTPPGLPTGHQNLDQFLWWNGLPRGGITVCSGSPGLGATSLWAQTAKNLMAQNGRVAWIEGSDSSLNPWFLRQRGLNLNHVFWISPPKNLSQKLWVLQELCATDTFSLIACSLTRENLKSHHIVKLKKLATRHQVALLVFTQKNFLHPLISLNLEFQRHRIVILRAQHRPTPHTVGAGTTSFLESAHRKENMACALFA